MNNKQDLENRMQTSRDGGCADVNNLGLARRSTCSVGGASRHG
ncbi:MAG: hypothetical protein ABIR27_08685 [Dokdonella sp.]